MADVVIRLTRDQAETVWLEIERIVGDTDSPKRKRHVAAIAARIRKALDNPDAREGT